MRLPLLVGSRTVHHGFDLGFGPPLQRLNPPEASYYIDRIAGTSFIYPVMSFEGCVAFVREDGRALAVDEAFRGCLWMQDIFQMMHWTLFKERFAGFETRELTMEERPLEFRW